MTDITPITPTHTVEHLVATAVRRTLALARSIDLPPETIFDAQSVQTPPLQHIRNLLGDLDALRQRLEVEGVITPPTAVALDAEDTPEGL